MSEAAKSGAGATPGPEKYFRERLAEGKFEIQHCAACDRYVFYPRVLCPHCGAARLEWRAASGRGTVYSTTVVRQRAEHGGDYNVALVDLAEGPRMMSRVVGCAPQEVTIGLRVKARIDQFDGQLLVMFERE